MSHPSRRKRIIRLWIGMILLSISVFIWMMLIIAMVAEPEEGGHVILSGLVLTIIPVVAGIYYVKHSIGRYKRRVWI